jgi:hypothetical protein
LTLFVSLSLDKPDSVRASAFATVSPQADVGRPETPLATAAGHCGDGLAGYFDFFKSNFLNPVFMINPA